MELNLHNRLDNYKLKELVDNVQLSEPFDYNATYILTIKEADKIALAVAYRLEKVEQGEHQGEVLPRFIHIVIGEQLRRSKKGLMALIMSEQYLAKMGYTQVFAYITKRNDMAILAQKFGYRGNGNYYFKSIGGSDVSRKTKH